MKRIVCAVFDTAVQTYGQPFFVVATGAAVRSFGDEVNRNAADNALNAHPEDFELYQLGYFDDVDGSLTTDNALLVRGKDVIRRDKPQQAAVPFES